MSPPDEVHIFNDNNYYHDVDVENDDERGDYDYFGGGDYLLPAYYLPTTCILPIYCVPTALTSHYHYHYDYGHDRYCVYDDFC